MSQSRFRLIVFSCFIIAVALGTTWLNMVVQKTGVISTDTIIRTNPDFYVDKFHFFRLEPTGKPLYYATGILLTHYPIDDSYLINKPIFKNTDNQKQLQVVRSETGRIADERTQIHLYDKVRANRYAKMPNNNLQLDSSYMLMKPDDNTLWTDRAVDAKQGTSTMSGIGMYANNATGELKLYNQAKATYMPPKTK